jgi:LmbE family N-acetylglucosaminyl deacetylase
LRYLNFIAKGTFMNILAIGAHPDDLDVVCGGTLARFCQAGENVTMCIVTDGRGHPLGDPERVSALRRAEAQASADLIGAKLRWLGLRDGALVDDVPTRHKFIQLMMDVSPDLIITHQPDDYHSDHILTSRLVTATIQMAWAPPPELEGEPVRKQVPVAFMTTANGINFTPEEYVDVSGVWEQKIEMVMNHRSQYLQGPDYNATQLQEPLDQYYLYRLTRVMDEFYGLACWCKYAEAFRWWHAADRFVTRRLLP